MTLANILEAIILGVVEGLTEFIPVSSTGHLLLAARYLNFQGDDSFVILIQLGAILALLAVYAERLWRIATALPKDREAQHFVLGVLVAFLPAVVLGVLIEHKMKQYLFNVPVVCYALIAGGLVLLAIEQFKIEKRFSNCYVLPLPVYLKIGLFQCLSMIPGVSRSGSTIVGGMLLGLDKRSAAEFSFFLAMPTMVGAFVYELAKSYKTMSTDNLGLTAIGFVTAFISGWFVVKTLLDFVSKRGLALFGWWRIVVGVIGLLAYYTMG
ncbi:undecaprenyl-diphosphate phosphatase [Labrys sp. KNU-23]|uniref:undecaprenyl-diphosphate phosphatase n=1 Tax=Labrys sp. KNU-23 TaxID=2789216 RepID=UPI0011ECC5E7|nr:undecaprenyl-diphosphate phosphatase [Labrys sp. KNU-23]QEN89318.1 undecaprenyl-diphosphate phosphatase [Labrys sp. KNU-23]